MTPAPTTPALKTNMVLTLLRRPAPARGSERVQIARALVREAPQRAAQRVVDRAPDEQPVDRRRERIGTLERVGERQRHAGVVAVGAEADLLGAAQPLVLDLQRLAGALLERGDPLEHAPAA